MNDGLHVLSNAGIKENIEWFMKIQGLVSLNIDYDRVVDIAAKKIAKISDALRTSDFFADLGERQLAMMASSGQRRTLSRYAVLYREGALATCFYVLVSGTLLESSLHPPWREPELRPGQRRPKGYSRFKRTLVSEKRAGGFAGGSSSSPKVLFECAT